jgi:hypothetical protein
VESIELADRVYRVKLGFYVPSLHFFFYSVHFFMDPTKSSMCGTLDFHGIYFCVLYAVPLLCIN